MLDPVKLLKVPDELVQLFYDLETDILKDIAERLVLNDFKLSPTSAYRLKKLDELGLHQDAVIKKIAAILKESEKKVKKAVTDTSYQNIRTDNEQLKKYDLFNNAYYDMGELRDIMMKGIRQTNGELKNITKSMAAAASKTYERALDNAYLKVRSGAYSYTEAINTAVDDLAKKGMETFTYKSGKHEQVASVIRRAVLTGVNKTAVEAQLKNLSNMGMNLVRTTQHLGARPTHEVWQGKTFYFGNPVEGYQSLEEGTGYGTGEGLGGWNCRHGIRIALEEMGISYTEQPIDTEENNRIYELEQQQRYNERMIREWKRRRDIKKAGGQDHAKESRKVKEWNARQESFIKAHPELKRQINRESILKASVSPRYKAYDIQNDEYPTDYREYSDIEINNIFEKNEKLLDFIFPNVKTAWTGKINYDEDSFNTALSKNLSITVSHKTSPSIILHELVHARSAGHEMKLFAENKVIEETSVHLLTQEISKQKGYSIIISGWEKHVDMLKELNNLSEFSKTDYEFAIKLLEQPMSKRLEWLEENVYAKMMQKDAMSMSEAIKILEKLGGR